jgi:hypothetical protein
MDYAYAKARCVKTLHPFTTHHYICRRGVVFFAYSAKHAYLRQVNEAAKSLQQSTDLIRTNVHDEIRKLKKSNSSSEKPVENNSNGSDKFRKLIHSTKSF